mmetsp:Transcript_33112/g.94951  ORF Transcript_33112/g.94951 Transcript_33112/m.94951 type:complete len:211 (+) Transcript_33112:360-992(+)
MIVQMQSSGCNSGRRAQGSTARATPAVSFWRAQRCCQRRSQPAAPKRAPRIHEAAPTVRQGGASKACQSLGSCQGWPASMVRPLCMGFWRPAASSVCRTPSRPQCWTKPMMMITTTTTTTWQTRRVLAKLMRRRTGSRMPDGLCRRNARTGPQPRAPCCGALAEDWRPLPSSPPGARPAAMGRTGDRLRRAAPPGLTASRTVPTLWPTGS